MRNARTRTALLRTSAATDVLRSGGNITVTGLEPIFGPDILKAVQFKYRAEVVKVETIGGSSWTPTASTKYIVEISDHTSSREGHSNSVEPRRYIYKTPADLTEMGATAALQREYVHGQLITKINNDSANNVVAATLGTGTGFTITDDAGYYPAKTASGQNPREGKTTIRLAKDENGRGWADATYRVLTTDAVYQFGEGTRMISDIPVVYALGGSNIVAGTIDCPMTVGGLGPVSGQQYDAFQIDSLMRSTIPTIGEVIGYRIQSNMIFVDNGAGTDTTNATGFRAFEKEMLRIVWGTFEEDPSSIVEFFDNGITVSSYAVASGGLPTATGVPSGAVGDVNVMNTGKNVFHWAIIGTATLMVPAVTSAGLNLDLDATDNDGIEITPNVGANCPKQFVIGKDEFSMYARVTITDVSDAEFLFFGFRKKEAYQTADGGYDTYTDLAALGFNTETNPQPIKILTNLNDAANVTATDTGLTWADAATKELEIRVLLDGTVQFYVNGVDQTADQATAFVFDEGDTVIPFIYHQLGTSSPSSVIIDKYAVIPSAYWKIRK